jgi:hypothetical protein
MKTTSPSSRINDKEAVRAKAVDGSAGRLNRSEGVRGCRQPRDEARQKGDQAA